MTARVIVGDCLAVMPTLAPASVDAIVCDPPYGLGFMGKAWDHGVPGVEFWQAALRVAKPGAHLVAFGGTRTYHRLTVAIEDAGWEIRDCLSWLYGSGFPKSHNVSKAIDRHLGNEREPDEYTGPNELNGVYGARMGGGVTLRRASAASAASAAWDGWGTALKPAWEPIVLARKPLAGTVAANVLAHSTGALNIDGCRIKFANQEDQAAAAAAAAQRACQDQNSGRTAYGDFSNGPASIAPYLAKMDAGRWPANVLLDEQAASQLDAASGDSRSTTGKPRASASPGNGYGMTHTGTEYDDFGGASRFFYTAKASRAERNAGLEDAAPRAVNHIEQRRNNGSGGLPNGTGEPRPRANHHPTVKPLDLMQWLCRLVTPKGGLILDPFAGSGTTGRAAVAEGFRFVGIELSEDYATIARARIAEYAPLFQEVAV